MGDISDITQAHSHEVSEFLLNMLKKAFMRKTNQVDEHCEEKYDFNDMV